MREITLPTSDQKFCMVKDKNKWRANMIILGKRYELSNVDTFKLLIKKGADIHANNDYALRSSAAKGHLEVVKLLIEKGADIHAYNNYALRWSAINGHLEVIQLLIEKGANILACDDYAL